MGTGGYSPFNKIRLIEEPTENNTSDQILVRKTDGDPLTEVGNVDRMSISDLPFVPLAGTEVGKSITGPLEFENYTPLKWKNDVDDNRATLISEDGLFGILVENAVTAKQYSWNLTNESLQVGSNDTNFKGIVGSDVFENDGTDPKQYLQNGNALEYLTRYDEKVVNYPDAINLRPFVILEKNGEYRTTVSAKDLVKDKISKMKPYYVNYETGSNSNDGLTEATAVKTIAYAYATLNARLLYLTGGIHKEDSWGTLNASYTNTDDLFIIGIGNKKTYITNSSTTTPTYSLQSGTTYQATVTNATVVVDMKFVDEKGYPLKLTEKFSIADVNATAGSFFKDTTITYFNLKDGRTPDASVLILKSTANANFNSNAGYLYIENIDFMGGGTVNGAHGVSSQISSGSTQVHIAKDCNFMYAQSATYNGNGGEGTRNLYNKVNWFVNCNAHGGSRDGFNGLADNSNKMLVIEEHTQGFNNGLRLSSASVNGSSYHALTDVIRIGCKYYANSGPNVADVDGAISFNVGVTAFDCKITSTVGNDCFDFKTTTGSIMYNYDCQSLNTLGAYCVSGATASTIYRHDNCFSKGFDRVINSSIQFITNLSTFPTSTVAKYDFPVLSAYTEQVPNTYSVVNSTTIALTSSDLNTNYPNVPIGYRVMAPNITLGALIYTKTSEAGSSDVWVSTTATIVV